MTEGLKIRTSKGQTQSHIASAWPGFQACLSLLSQSSWGSRRTSIWDGGRERMLQIPLYILPTVQGGPQPGGWVVLSPFGIIPLWCWAWELSIYIATVSFSNSTLVPTPHTHPSRSFPSPVTSVSHDSLRESPEPVQPEWSGHQTVYLISQYSITHASTYSEPNGFNVPKESLENESVSFIIY